MGRSNYLTVISILLISLSGILPIACGGKSPTSPVPTPTVTSTPILTTPTPTLTATVTLTPTATPYDIYYKVLVVGAGPWQTNLSYGVGYVSGVPVTDTGSTVGIGSVGSTWISSGIYSFFSGQSCNIETWGVSTTEFTVFIIDNDTGSTLQSVVGSGSATVTASVTFL